MDSNLGRNISQKMLPFSNDFWKCLCFDFIWCVRYFNQSQQTCCSFHQSGAKQKPIMTWLARVFPRLTPVACICFEFWLGHYPLLRLPECYFHYNSFGFTTRVNRSVFCVQFKIPQPYLFEVSSDKPDEPDTPVHVGTPLTARRHRWRDFLSALTAFSATRLASLSTSATSGLLDSIMTSCFNALCTPSKRTITDAVWEECRMFNNVT